MENWTDYITTEEDYYWGLCEHHRQEHDLPTDDLESIECPECPAKDDCPMKEPYAYGVKVKVTVGKNSRHSLDTAYVLDHVPVHGGGYRYRAVWPVAGRKPIIGKLYSEEIKEWVGYDEGETDRLFREAP
jgi:hypothetical protein